MKTALLLLEFILICVVLPSIIIAWRLAPFMFLFLWGTCLLCFLIYRRCCFEGWRKLWNWEAVTKGALKPILIRWALCSIGMLAFIYFYDPARMFGLLINRPYFVPFLFVLYPVLSALPQEFIFCSYFFSRFKPLFKTEQAQVIASAIVFAYAHMLFINWVAPLLSFIAGLIFARTYADSKSLALVTIEHGLYWNVLFLVGLGWYFYGGAVAAVP